MVSYHFWQFGDEGGLDFLSGTGWLPSGSTDFSASKGAPNFSPHRLVMSFLDLETHKYFLQLKLIS